MMAGGTHGDDEIEEVRALVAHAACPVAQLALNIVVRVLSATFTIGRGGR